jgi:hypothetical protein
MKGNTPLKIEEPVKVVMRGLQALRISAGLVPFMLLISAVG